MKSILSLCFAGLFCAFGLNRALSQPNPPSQPVKTTALRANALVAVRTGKTINNAIVLIEGNQIKAVGTNLSIPPNATILDLGEVTLLPGLIDAHTHILHQYYREFGDDNANRVLEMAQMNLGNRVLLGTKIGRDVLEAGFTTVRDLGNSGTGGDVALRDGIRSGWTTGPRVFASTRALSPVGGQFQYLTPAFQQLIKQEYVPIEGVEQARQAVRQAVYEGADCIKVIVNSGPKVISLEEMKAIVDEAHRAKRSVAAHCTDGDGPAMIAAEAGVNSIEHGYTISEKVLNIMAQKNIFLVPTDVPGVERYQQRIQRAVKAGVKIALGSDLYYNFPGQTRGEVAAGMFTTYILSGMSPLEVLRAATINSAELVDPSNSIGVLEAGRLADIIAVKGDPLQDISSLKLVVFVMKDGQIIKNTLVTDPASPSNGNRK
jgi:imidazolonepropionase-like amidohydrolase